MDEASINGIDLAKRSFQVHGAKADGSVAERVKLLDCLAAQPKCRWRCRHAPAPNTGAGEILALGHEVSLAPHPREPRDSHAYHTEGISLYLRAMESDVFDRQGREPTVRARST